MDRHLYRRNSLPDTSTSQPQIEQFRSSRFRSLSADRELVSSPQRVEKGSLEKQKKKTEVLIDNFKRESESLLRRAREKIEESGLFLNNVNLLEKGIDILNSQEKMLKEIQQEKHDREVRLQKYKQIQEALKVIDKEKTYSNLTELQDSMKHRDELAQNISKNGKEITQKEQKLQLYRNKLNTFTQAMGGNSENSEFVEQNNIKAASRRSSFKESNPVAALAEDLRQVSKEVRTPFTTKIRLCEQAILAFERPMQAEDKSTIVKLRSQVESIRDREEWIVATKQMQEVTREYLPKGLSEYQEDRNLLSSHFQSIEVYRPLDSELTINTQSEFETVSQEALKSMNIVLRDLMTLERLRPVTEMIKMINTSDDKDFNSQWSTWIKNRHTALAKLQGLFSGEELPPGNIAQNLEMMWENTLEEIDTRGRSMADVLEKGSNPDRKDQEQNHFYAIIDLLHEKIVTAESGQPVESVQDKKRHLQDVLDKINKTLSLDRLAEKSDKTAKEVKRYLNLESSAIAYGDQQQMQEKDSIENGIDVLSKKVVSKYTDSMATLSTDLGNLKSAKSKMDLDIAETKQKILSMQEMKSKVDTLRTELINTIKESKGLSLTHLRKHLSKELQGLTSETKKYEQEEDDRLSQTEKVIEENNRILSRVSELSRTELVYTENGIAGIEKVISLLEEVKIDQQKKSGKSWEEAKKLLNEQKVAEEMIIDTESILEVIQYNIKKEEYKKEGREGDIGKAGMADLLEYLQKTRRSKIDVNDVNREKY